MGFLSSPRLPLLCEGPVSLAAAKFDGVLSRDKVKKNSENWQLKSECWITKRKQPFSFSFLKKKHSGTSLVVQWLIFHASTAGTPGSIPGQGTKIPHATRRSRKNKQNNSNISEPLLCRRLCSKIWDSVEKDKPGLIPDSLWSPQWPQDLVTQQMSGSEESFKSSHSIFPFQVGGNGIPEVKDLFKVTVLAQGKLGWDFRSPDTWPYSYCKYKYILLYIIYKCNITGIHCFILLCFIKLHRYCIFYKLKVCGNSESSKSFGTIFTTAFAHFASLCHILVILAISQTFPLLLYLLWWSVISDLCCYYCNYFGVPWTTPIWDSKLNKCCVCSDCSTDQLFPPLSPSPQASLFPGTQQCWN